MKRKILSVILAAALLLNTGMAALAAETTALSDLDSGSAIGASGDVGCTCEAAEDEAHAEDCPLYEAPDESEQPAEPTCTCEATEGEAHSEGCALYEAPADPACTCGVAEGEAHTEGCALYEAPAELVCTCETKCAGDVINAECEVCAADMAACAGESAEDPAVAAVRALIAALPGAEAVAAMSTEEQNAVYDALLAADDAYQALNEEQKGQLAGENAKLDALFAYFNSPNMAAPAADHIAYIDANGETQSCDSATDVTANDSTWNTGWYYASGSITINRRVTVDGDVHLILADGCNLTISGGIGVDEGNSFTIYAQSTSEDTMGKLAATGGRFQAGIGGTDGNSGAITINGGTVTATGGSDSGAGIGGADGGNGSNITINGGVITATGGAGSTYGAAGIGGGYDGSGSNITINGGTVEAYGSSGSAGGGAGIGGGSYNSGSNIAINGGNVTATGGKNGAGIGGGSERHGSDITISDGVVTATGGNNGAGIGGGGTFSGNGGNGSNITISGGTVTATGGTGIGGGSGSSSGGMGDVTISGGTVTATGGSGGSGGAGIGGGKGGEGGAGNVTITGGAVTATGGSGGAGIGGGWGGNWGGTGGEGTVEITGGAVTATGGNGGAGIGGGGGGSSGYGGAGNVTISDGTVTANGGNDAVDIGGGYGSSNEGASEVNISGGTVTTEDGDSGIGGTPEISGGTVNGTSYDPPPAPTPGPATGDGGGSPSNDSGSGSSGGNHDDENANFWQGIIRSIEDAKDGDTVKANARYYDRMPVSVMEALLDNPGVTLVIDWYGGDTITIPAGRALDERNRIYYPLSYLEGIDFGEAAAFENTNPQTGGDTFEIAAPATTNAITTPEVTDSRRGLAETPELAEKGIEQVIPGVYEPESIAPALDAAAPQSNSGGLHGIWVLLAALAVGGGHLYFRKRNAADK